ncbi:outer membrane protein [Microvirga makkahensis]|uniref:Outer membrane beta-barrel protein n=1 Tax=Microvirga makkahensis TaxID=1128670 RepID=A0A7X3SMU2_9HYPH|nr:outer membrane beta-barrel protein [Microvirga makkahensis]MXQ10369.1 outer membrane beta-barrel protein [Microvirga makkahensis]
MKKILLASVALFGFAGAASAADLPMRAAPPAPIVAAAPIFTWTGFYVGVNAGYGWNDDAEDIVFDPTTTIVGDSDEDGGFIGGAQIGYNYQIGSFVVGLEGDIQYADFGSVTYAFPTGTVTLDSEDWFGTARARAGVAFDRALIYATGGFAFTDNRSGWTLGGGLEYAFTNNLSAKIEGLYVNLDEDDFDFDGVTYSTGESDFGVVRAGLNFRFGTY